MGISAARRCAVPPCVFKEQDERKAGVAQPGAPRLCAPTPTWVSLFVLPGFSQPCTGRPALRSLKGGVFSFSSAEVIFDF